MIQIISDNLTHPELQDIHKMLCIMHKIDYSCYIDIKDDKTITTLKED
jgi:hypothetical protein